MLSVEEFLRLKGNSPEDEWLANLKGAISEGSVQDVLPLVTISSPDRKTSRSGLVFVLKPTQYFLRGQNAGHPHDLLTSKDVGARIQELLKEGIRSVLAQGRLLHVPPCWIIEYKEFVAPNVGVPS